MANTNLSFMEVDAPDDKVYTGLGITESRAEALQDMADAVVENKDSLTKAMSFFSREVQTPQELTLVAYYLGVRIGKIESHMKSLLAEMLLKKFKSEN